MSEIKYILRHCTQSSEYKLELIEHSTSKDLNDPCVLWVFDSRQENVALKLMANLNAANHLNHSYH